MCEGVWSVGEVEDWQQHCQEAHANNNQVKDQTDKIFTCRISGCKEGPRTFDTSSSFLKHLKEEHGYSEENLKETRESSCCSVAQDVKSVYGEQIYLPNMSTEMLSPSKVRLCQFSGIFNCKVDCFQAGEVCELDLQNRLCCLCGEEVGQDFSGHFAF